MNVKIYNKIKSWRGSLVYGYLIAMFSFFLFFFRNYYFDMTPTKYAFFQTATLILIGCAIVVGILLCKKETLKFSYIKEVLRHLSITDWAFLFMFCSHLITTILSKDPSQSFSGSNGRQMGLLFTFLITSMYFIVSRWHRLESSVILIYLGCTSLVVLLGILNFYGFDPFHFSTLLSDFDVQRYLSTIGNITFFAHLICLSLPISCVLYIHAINKNSRIIYGCFIASGFIGLYISNIDGAYLGIMAFFAFLLYYCLFSYQKMMKLLSIVILALCVGKILYIPTLLFPELGRGFATISYWIVSSTISTIALCLLTFLYVFALQHKEKLIKLPYPRIAKGYLYTLIFAIISILAVVFYFSVINTDIDLGYTSNYIRYSDDWGTGRGLIWNRLMPLYLHDFTILEKLFGPGLDSVRTLMVNNYVAGDIAAYDNAHNEYIQYLVTSGLFGLLSYLTLFLSIQIRLYKYGKQEPWMIALLGCFIAHAMQAITGLNQPITTPILFILIAIGECHIRSYKKQLQDMDT